MIPSILRDRRPCGGQRGNVGSDLTRLAREEVWADVRQPLALPLRILGCPCCDDPRPRGRAGFRRARRGM
jgi:hypothetical protein